MKFNRDRIFAELQKFWDNLFGLDYSRSIWIEQSDLGAHKLITHKRKRYRVKIPKKINKVKTLRLRGLGNTKDGRTGDLYLQLLLNKGEDLRETLWLSEAAARDGARKKLSYEGGVIWLTVPPDSYAGLTIRLKGLGRVPDFRWRAPFLPRVPGNLLVKLVVYPDRIKPYYGSFDMLATEDMNLEGWVYRKIDHIFKKIGKLYFMVSPMDADKVADTFNQWGYYGIFTAFVDHMRLNHLNIKIYDSNMISLPGNCQRHNIMDQETGASGRRYSITINSRFIKNPFASAAIIAHELCHVFHSERIEEPTFNADQTAQSEEDTLEVERTVDLLVFMFKLGEFQLRVSRDERLTIGYFNQRIFERMQGIVSRKLK